MAIESVRWGRGRKERFVEFIDAELQDALGPHGQLVQQWVKWLELYRAPVKQPVRNIPYEGAANFMLPVTATDVDQLYAKFIQTIHAPDNLWTLKPLNERWTDAAKPLQDFLQWLDASRLKMYGVNKRVIGEMVKLGTGIYKHGWYYERRPVLEYNPNTQKLERFVRVRGGPFVDHVRLADFVIPPTAYAVQPDAQGGATWVAERMRMPVERLRWLAQSSEPFLPNVSNDDLEMILKFEEAGVTEYDAAIQSNDYEKRATGSASDFESDGDRRAKVSGGKPAPTRYLREIELYEIHARFAATEDTSESDIVVWFHRPTRRIVRAVVNHYNHGARPYEVVRYFPGDGFYGIGVCEQKEFFQLAQSDLFNFNWDNVLLANSRMVVAKAGANIAPGEPFYPNKVWVVDEDVNKAFGVFPMADVYPSLGQLQSQLQAWGERRTGISDIQLGNLQELPGRTPATTMMSLLQEGNRRPDLTIKDMKFEGISNVGLRTIQNCQQFIGNVQEDVGGQRLLEIAVQMLGTPEGLLAAEKLVMPAENAEDGLGVSITATSGSANKEVEKQGYLELIQLSGQVGQQAMQLMQVVTMMPGTPMAAVAMQNINALQVLLKRLYEQYDIRNTEEVLPVPPQQQATLGLQQTLGSPGLLGGAGGLGAGAVGAGGAGPAAGEIDPGMAALFSGAGGGL